MAWYDMFSRVGRRRNEPKRDTALYPRLMNIGGLQYTRDRPMVKPTPANLRRFAKTTYARRLIRSIKDPIAMLDWEIAPKEGVEFNSELQRQIEVTTACFAKPNRDDSFSTLVEQAIEDQLTCGAAAIEHQIGGDPARPLWMWPTDAISIQVFAGWDGDNSNPRYWQALGYGNVGGVQGRAIRNDELIFAKVDPNTESPFGVGAIEIAFSTINRLMGVQSFAGNVASNATPENLLFFKGLDSDSLDRIRTYWRNEVEGQGNAPLFGGEAEPESIQMRGANDDALFLKYQEVLIRELFAAGGMSPQNAGLEADVNRNVSEVAEDRDWRSTIVPTAKRLGMHLNREVVEQKLGFSQIEFKWVGLDRDDEKASADIFEIRYRSNMITPNEERGRLNMPPSDSPWADLTYADTQIAMQAARSAAVVDDDELPKPSNSSPKPTGPQPKPNPKDRPR